MSRSVFDQLIDAAQSDDPHVRGQALQGLDRLRDADLEPAVAPPKVKFSERMRGLRAPKGQRNVVTNQLPPEPRPETLPRFSLEMPATTGATILTETPLKRIG